MKRLFLDTNILCQEGFSSRNMAVLTRLVKAQHLTIYLSEISKREFISRYTFEINEKVKKVTDQIKKDIKLFSGKPRKRLEKRIEQIKSTYEDINKQAILDLATWKKP
jgi:predicted nucleic acid-binding protein